MSEEEINSARLSNGFVYLQAKPTKDMNPLYPTFKDCILFFANIYIYYVSID